MLNTKKTSSEDEVLNIFKLLKLARYALAFFTSAQIKRIAK